MVLTGMEVTATDPLSMNVRIYSGTYRMDNTLYVFSEANNFFYEMNDPPEIIMGIDPVLMGGQYFVVAIPAAHGSPKYGRYDILVVGPHDGLIHVVSGTAVNLSTTEPVMPTTPADHVLVDWVFIQYGDTEVTDGMIGQTYGSPAPETVTVLISGTYVVGGALLWNVAAPPQYSCSITISAKDQYGGTWNFGGVRGTLTKVGGFGQVYGSYTGWTSSVAESQANTTVSFQYERDQTEAEMSPVLVYESTGFSTVFVLPILNVGGDPM
jgi:hypothetical protein